MEAPAQAHDHFDQEEDVDVQHFADGSGRLEQRLVVLLHLNVQFPNDRCDREGGSCSDSKGKSVFLVTCKTWSYAK
jgi:hypothetical protein